MSEQGTVTFVGSMFMLAWMFVVKWWELPIDVRENGGLYVGSAIITAAVARRRGYSFFLWLLLGLSLNPWVVIFVIASLPDRSMDRRRTREAADLDRELDGAGLPAPPSRRQIDGSLGDRSTQR